MANDPAFLFYPGDYLRDTQCLSEKVQVSYDRIMCEHMRNICISQQQLKFFTKRLSEDEKEELMYTLTKVNGGYQIEWVALSIMKRRAYSESRRKNKAGKKKNICKSYDNHMENEIENRDKDKNLKESFDKFRKVYPGTKRGLNVEYENLKLVCKKHKLKISEVIPLLKPAIENKIKANEIIKDNKPKAFIAEYKYLKTWLNDRCWTEETPIIKEEEQW